MRNIDPVKSTLYYAIVFGLMFVLTSCPDEPEPDYSIKLTLEDYLCTWVDLRIELPDSGNVKYFSVKSLDGEFEVKHAAGVTAADTIIRIDGLQPETDYSFRAYYLKKDRAVDSSDVLTVQTRETTSSDFRWEIDRIGVHPTHFNDVQIISEDDVWAVGDIRLEDTYTYDSVGVWQEPYDAAHWNGEKWVLKRLNWRYPFHPEGMWFYSDTSIWLASGDAFHFTGDTTYHIWSRNYDSGEFLYRVWGSAEDDIWFVGTEGLIMHYDGRSFNRIPTGNTIRYIDVEGTPDGRHVFVVGNNILVPYECCVWHIKEGEMNMIYYTDTSAPVNGKYGEVMSVGVYDKFAYFQTAAGIWIYDYQKNISELFTGTSNEAVSSIIVQDRNDVFGFGSIWVHFDGVNWITNNDLFWSITWPKADFKGDFVVAVGLSRDANQGVIIRGYR